MEKRMMLCIAVLALVSYGGFIAYAGGMGPVESCAIIPSGDSAILNFHAFCIDYGKNFPEELNPPAGLAEDGVRSAIYCGYENDYTLKNFYQVQLAIWHQVDGTWYDEDRALAEEIDACASEYIPPIDLVSPGIPLHKALDEGLVKITYLKWEAIEDPKGRLDWEYYGVGQMKIENLTDEKLTVHLAYGTVLPPKSEDEQNMAAFDFDDCP